MTTERTQERSRWRWLLWAALVLVVAGGVGAVALVRRGQVVRWAEVMEAANRQDTINGVGRIYQSDGSEWAVSVWVRVDGPGAFTFRSMVLPVKAGPKQRPGHDVTTGVCAADFVENGVFPDLAKGNQATLGRPSEWSGRHVLEVTLPPDSPERPPAEQWRFYVDRETKLVQGLEFFDSGKLLMRADYRYNRPLPKGFTPGA